MTTPPLTHTVEGLMALVKSFGHIEILGAMGKVTALQRKKAWEDVQSYAVWLVDATAVDAAAEALKGNAAQPSEREMGHAVYHPDGYAILTIERLRELERAARSAPETPPDRTPNPEAEDGKPNAEPNIYRCDKCGRWTDETESCFIGDPKCPKAAISEPGVKP